MSTAGKTFLSAIGAIVVLILVALFFSVSWRSEARMNRGKVVQLLAEAHFVQTQGRDGTRRVALRDNTTVLVPDQGEVIAGYVFKLHVRSTTFTIEAQPFRWGETGTLSFFRDEAGVIRFDASGPNADANSSPWPTSF